MLLSECIKINGRVTVKWNPQQNITLLIDCNNALTAWQKKSHNAKTLYSLRYEKRKTFTKNEK